MSNCTLIPILVLAVLLLSASPAAAFGSGSVSEASGVFGRNFLHGDVEGVLTELVKTTASAGIIGAIFSGGRHGGKKFNENDVARVYFGNWLRDLSQAVDVAALKLLPAQRIVNVVAVLGFLEFGYATREFEVTPERLGNYLTVEHIDNPTGYPDDKGSDPREVANYPKLRGPLNPRELEIDQRNGMKQYIATEGQDFDTAVRFIKDNIIRCIELGRSGKHNESDEWESLRLLGTALHTLEDFAAHSNFLEVSLNKLGYDRVFQHVGDRVRIRSPSGKEVAPIVTGSFGGADFMHSMLGTAEDKLSQSSAQDVSAKFNDNKGKDGGPLRTVLKLLLSKDDKDDGDTDTKKNPDQQVDRLEELRRKASEMSGVNVSEEDVANFLHEVLSIHDDIRRTISGVIDRIPGLDELLGEVTNNLSVFVFSTLEPVMGPIFKTVTNVLFEASAAVVDNHDQTIVFNDENASDPTHSMLAKDHFNNLLNAPAGKVAQIIVRHTVQQVVEAWDDEGKDPRGVADSVVTALHHPDFVENPNAVQQDMIRFVDTWINSHGNEKDEVLRRLERDSVLHHRNNTDGISGGNTIAAANENVKKYSAASQGLAGLVKPGGILADAPGANVVAGVLSTLNINDDKKPQQQQQQQQSSNSYSQSNNQNSFNRHDNDNNNENRRQENETRYGSGNNNSYDDNRRNDENRYGNSYGGNNNDNDRRRPESNRFDNQNSYGGNNDRFEQENRHGQQSFGQQQYQPSYGGGRNNDDDNNRRHGRNDDDTDGNRFGRNDEENRFGGNRRQDNDDNRNEYGRPQQSFGGGGENRRHDNEFGGGRPEGGFGGGYGGGRDEGRDEGFGRRPEFGRDDEPRFGGGRRDERDDQDRRFGGNNDFRGQQRDDDRDRFGRY
ncbi:Het-C-domain-containing protein [Testicularia cyperi]|uniref:Het-C-domain-containing protein n=1 Tax=Testicularia cyperi TaxID=1882483 RepID=A0A317XT63_9BASI|nr:Het-C-domain-containing protein [Testicularia cyperi]